MAPPRTLANSPWPRSAGDAGNRRVFAADGPSQPRLSAPIELPRSPSDGMVVSGGVIADDGELRVVHGDYLSRVALDGTVRWSLSLRAIELELVPPPEEADEDELRRRAAAAEAGEEEEKAEDRLVSHSLPTALSGGRTLVTVRWAALIVDANGLVEARLTTWEPFGGTTDDSGISPNVTRSGTPIVTMPIGTPIAWEGEAGRELGDFGYDLVPPAIYADDSLALAGYAGRGLCRVRLSGEIVWERAPKDADMLPTVSRAQVCAVGSLNDECSWLVDVDGRQIGIYGHSAIFAEYVDSGWIAATTRWVARLGPRGAELWSAEIAHELRWGVFGPIVDRSGRVYVQGEEWLIGLDPQGARVFALHLGAGAGTVFPAGAGVFAVVVEGALRFMADGR